MSIEYSVYRSNREKISITIYSPENIVVRAPKGCSDSYIHNFVNANKDWIERKISQLKKNTDDQELLTFQKVLYLGNYYPVKKTRKDSLLFNGTSFYFPRYFDVLGCKTAYFSWLKDEAKFYLFRRTSEIAELMGITYNNVKLSSAKRRWGSCSSAGNINLNWRLMCCDSFAIDYVIIHELTHRLIMNHSSEFWNKVEEFYPDYKLAQSKLKEYEQLVFRYYGD